MCKSVGRHTITQNLIIADGVAAFSASIAGVALDGINHAIFHPCDDAHMIGLTILGARGAIRGIPVEEDNHAGNRCGGVICPQSPIPKPLHAIDTSGKLGNHAHVNITALVCAPGYKAGTPFHTLGKAIPAPIGLSAHIAKLGLRNGHDLFVRGVDSICTGQVSEVFGLFPSPV